MNHPTRWKKRPANNTRRVHQPKSGWLDLNAIPWAKVYVDGVFHGPTPLQGVKLAAGWHRLKLVFPTRKRSITRKIFIRAQRITTRVIELDRTP